MCPERGSNPYATIISPPLLRRWCLPKFQHLGINITRKWWVGFLFFTYFFIYLLAVKINFHSNKGYYHAYRAIERLRSAVTTIPTLRNTNYTTTAFSCGNRSRTYTNIRCLWVMSPACCLYTIPRFVGEKGFEPLTSPLYGGALSTWATLRSDEPLHSIKIMGLTLFFYVTSLVEDVGNDPTTSWMSTKRSPFELIFNIWASGGTRTPDAC